VTALVHLDTDIGGDPDDGCALAMLLGSDLVLAGVTTTVDPHGQRAGYAAHLLRLAGRADVPVAAGAGVTVTAGDIVEPLPQLWPPRTEARPGSLQAAHDLLVANLERAATIVAVGPLTTLATLERHRPGALCGARLVVMGGWAGPLPGDLPAYGPGDDWNVAVDPQAALVVATSGADITWVTLAATLRTSLRACPGCEPSADWGPCSPSRPWTMPSSLARLPWGARTRACPTTWFCRCTTRSPAPWPRSGQA